MSDVELLPCPFCGEQPAHRETVEHYAADGKHPAGTFTSQHHIACDHCGVERSEEYFADAIAAWNRRPAPAGEDE